jgi:hypothetical protein
MCPYCGRDFKMHSGSLCPILDNAIARSIAAAVALVEDQRSERAKRLALSQSVTPRVVRLDNAQPQALCSFNINRGSVLIYNDDAADIFLGQDKQHVVDATMRFTLKTKTAIAFTSPAELWGFGGAAGPQLVSVLELPPGRSPMEFAFLAKLA